MNQRQQNRLSMNKAVLQILDANTAVWQSLPAFLKARNELYDAVAGLNFALQQQTITSTGVTEDKQADLDEALSKVLMLARNTSAYAMEAKNNDLYARVSYSRSFIMRLPDNEQVALLSDMLAQVTNNVPQLANYGVTADGIAQASNALARASAILVNPRTTITRHATATETVPLLMAKSRHALAIMDRLVHNFTETNDTFVSHYRNARLVVSVGTRTAGKDVPPAAS